VVRPPGIKIAFLQMDDVGLCTGQKLDNPLELQTAIDVPIHDPDGTGRTKNPPRDCKVARFYLLHRCISLLHFCAAYKVMLPNRDVRGMSNRGLKQTRSIVT
jgi:hypothetical protein